MRYRLPPILLLLVLILMLNPKTTQANSCSKTSLNLTYTSTDLKWAAASTSNAGRDTNTLLPPYKP